MGSDVGVEAIIQESNAVRRRFLLPRTEQILN